MEFTNQSLSSHIAIKSSRIFIDDSNLLSQVMKSKVFILFHYERLSKELIMMAKSAIKPIEEKDLERRFGRPVLCMSVTGKMTASMEKAD